MNKLKFFFILAVFCSLGIIGWNIYSYFFKTSLPSITIFGLHDNHAYKGEVACSVMLQDDYKVQEVGVYLDDALLNPEHERIGKKCFDYSLVLPTKNVPDGKHRLKIEVFDGSYHRNKSSKEIHIIVDNKPLHAAFVRPEATYKVFQGRTLHLQFQVNKEIKDAFIEALGKTYPCFPESPRSKVYECFIPIACEESPNEYLFSIEISDVVGNKINLDNKFQIIAYPFKRQRITVSDEKLKKEAEAGKSHEEFEDRIKEITASSPAKKMWQGQFIAPTEMKEIGAEFGVHRTSQQRGRYIHQGLDILNAPHSVVWAPQDGIVVLKDRFEISGNTVVIDHGYGILSMFFHLDEFAKIEVGDEIKKGNPVGKIGKSGYATGYHLHWEMRVVNIPVDPNQWTKADF